jgi:hypothetical protein
MKKAFFIGLAGLLAAFPLAVFMPSTSYALNGNLQQRILPLECVFEVVNDGSNTITYLTPEACGIIIPPDPEPETDPNQPNSPTTPVGGVILPPTRIQTGTGIIQTPGLVIPNSQNGLRAARELPFEPVAVLQSSEEAFASSQTASTSVIVVAVVIGLAALGLIILIALA